MLVETGTVDHALVKSYETYATTKAANGKLLGGQLPYMPVIGLGKPGANASIHSRWYERQLKPVAYELNFATDTALTHSMYQTIPKMGSKL